MKAFLMHRDRDVDLERALPPNAEALSQDLELPTLLSAMAAGDEYLLGVCGRAVLEQLTEPDAIVYRQQVLADCLGQPAVVREIYDIAVTAILGEKRFYFSLFRDSPESILYRSVQVLEFFVDLLKKLRQVADSHAASVRSEGFVRLFAMLASELGDEYFRTVEHHLRELKFRRGTLISAGLGKGNKPAGYVLRAMPQRRTLVQRGVDRVASGNRGGYSFVIPERDENGSRALGELRNQGINLVANALAQSTDHILSFFGMLRAELAFYVGCLNLHDRLAEKGEPVCFPVPVAAGEPVLSGQGLYDVCLALTLPGSPGGTTPADPPAQGKVVGNDVAADGKRLVMITGANQGGKSSFLRSVGLAQLMMQCGMFVPARSLRASVCAGVFTHYKREEDAAMKSGKLDEELSRMNAIADQIAGNCVLLCNESFASTNEREGSEIARQIVRALVEAGVRVLYVTHLFDLADGFRRQQREDTLFLRAQRHSDGRRTFRVLPGKPLPTSHGEDLYRKIFRADPEPATR